MPEEKKPISDEDAKKVAGLISTLATRFLTGEINKATFIHGLRIFSDALVVCAYPFRPAPLERVRLMEMLKKGDASEYQYLAKILKVMSDDEYGYFASRVVADRYGSDKN